MENKSNFTKYVFLVVSLLLIASIGMIPYRADAEGNFKYQKGYFNINTGDNYKDRVEDYRFDVIEDNELPLSSGKVDYSENVLRIVACCFAVAVVALYFFWFIGHRKRICFLADSIGMNLDCKMESISALHPIRTIRFENELENKVVSSSTKSV